MSDAASPPSPPRAWILAARPATLPAAAIPVFVGSAVAIAHGATLKPLVVAATLLAAALLIQIGTNFANDYSDFHRGADHEGRLGPLRVTQSGLITPPAVRRGIMIAFGLALLPGLYLVWVGGWPILLIGIVSIVSGLAYTGGPWPLGYHGLGDVFVFVFFGLIAVAGSAYLQLGAWSSLALMVAVPIGLLVTNILVVNNLRDLATDRAAGKRTLAVRLGDHGTRLQYALFTVLAYAAPTFLAFRASAREWLLLPWLSAPFAVLLVRHILGGASGRDLNPVLERTGRLLVAFGLLLVAGLWLARPY